MLAFVLIVNRTAAAVPPTFTEIPLQTTGFRSAGLSWGDYDGDGRLDLLAGGDTSAGQQLLLYRQDNGTLVPGPFVAVSGFTGATAWADYDGDGDLDFAAGGFSRFPDGQLFPPLGARLFRNDGASGFVALGTEILMSGEPTWADFDRDGDVDLLLAGAASEPSSGDHDLRRLRIYVNEPGKPWRLGWEWVLEFNSRVPLVDDWDRDGWPDIVYTRMRTDDTMAMVFLRNRTGLQFEAVESDYSGSAWPYMTDWGDFDNDGDLDAVFNGEIRSTRVLRLLRNDGAQQVPIVLPGEGGLPIAWADYDNDGRLDFATSEEWEGGVGSYLRLHHNEGTARDPVFATTDLPFRGAGFGTIAWADYDQDGDADLAISGFTNGVPSLRLFRNDLTTPNPPPTVPDGLRTTVGVEGAVELAWNAATDANQPGALTYNARVGRAPGTVDVMPPHADVASGRLWVPRRGNAGTQLRSVLTNLLTGTYHWSVQAVDHGFASSPFATESQFTVPPGRPRAGDITAFDIRYQHATLSGLVIPNGAETVAWFEYGPGPDLGLSTAAQPMGSGVAPVGLTNEVTDLLTAVTYHYRLVASNAVGLARSAEGTFFITNTLPALDLASRVTNWVGRALTPIAFTVSDLETPAGSLVVTAVGKPSLGQNTNLLDAAGIVLDGSGPDRTLTLTPTSGQRGAYRVLVTVTDQHGGQTARSIELQVVDFVRAAPLPADPGNDLAWIDVDRDGWLDLVGDLKWIYNQHGTNLTSLTGPIVNPIAGILAPADANGDGLVDFAVTGTRSGVRMTQVFTNRAFVSASTLQFKGLPTALTPGLVEGVQVWADYDADGDPDLFALGGTNNTPIAAFATLAWRNDGNLEFTAVGGILPKLSLGSMAWADFDRDGDLDVCLLGSTNRAITGAYTRIFRNDGTGTFTEVNLDLPPFHRGFAAWGDFNADGRLDLALSGVRQASGRTTNEVLVLRQESDGTFSRFASLDPLIDARGLWVDFDNDGDLDLAYSGDPVLIFPASAFRLYLNEGGSTFRNISPAEGMVSGAFAFGDSDGDGDLDIATLSSLVQNTALLTNAIPDAPSGLSAAVNGSDVAFTWEAAHDANQHGDLTYNLRVGTSPGGVDILSPLAHPVTGMRHVVAPGNAWSSGLWNLRTLAPGTYYWSVQAVDNTCAGGPFAAEQSFLIGGVEPPAFVSIESGTPGTLTLTVSATRPVRATLQQSSDLSDWITHPIVDLPAGVSSLDVPMGTESSLFFRWRVE